MKTKKIKIKITTKKNLIKLLKQNKTRKQNDTRLEWQRAPLLLVRAEFRHWFPTNEMAGLPLGVAEGLTLKLTL